MLAINPPQTVQQQESHGRPDGPMHAIGVLSRQVVTRRPITDYYD
jgi:hypothetical protein